MMKKMALLLVMLLASPAAPVPPVKIAVLDIASSGEIDPGTMRVFSELIENRLRERGHEVIGRSDIEALLGLDRAKDALGCESSSCAAELGGALGVDELIGGFVHAVTGDGARKRVVVTLRRYDARKSRVIAATDEQAELRGSETLLKLIEPMLDVLYGSRKRTGGAAGLAQPSQPSLPALPSCGAARLVVSTTEMNGQFLPGTVFVDGEGVGASPLTREVSACAKLLRATAPGYAPAEMPLNLRPGQTYKAQLRMSSLQGPVTSQLWFKAVIGVAVAVTVGGIVTAIIVGSIAPGGRYGVVTF